MWLDLLALIGGMVILVLGADWLVDGAVGLARKLGVPMLVIGLVVVAYGTSLPEFVVSLLASIRGNAEIGVGNVLGSNVANVGLVLGLSATICPILVRDPALLKRELPLLTLVTGLGVFFLTDGVVERYEGAILLAGAIFFTVRSFLNPPKKEEEEAEEEQGAELPLWKILLLLVVGIAGLVGGAQLMVNGGSNVAKALGISERVIGLTIVAVGTSLPELATSAVSAFKGHSALAIGNVVGSNYFNLTCVMGAASTISPMKVDASGQWIDLAVMCGFTVILWPMMRTGHKISRVEGVILLAGYVGYITWLVIQSVQQATVVAA